MSKGRAYSESTNAASKYGIIISEELALRLENVPTQTATGVVADGKSMSAASFVRMPLKTRELIDRSLAIGTTACDSLYQSSN